MNLLCIQKATQSLWPDGRPAPKGPDVIVGSEYTAYDTILFEDGLSYFLVGLPGNTCYHSSLFATLPDSTAEEMEEETKEGVLC